MNGDGEDIIGQERRILCYRYYDDEDKISITLSDDDEELNIEMRTLSEVRDLIERRVENGMVSKLLVYSYDNNTRPTEQECISLGRSCLPLLAHHLEELAIHGERLTDLETSCILRHMSLQSSTIHRFRMDGNDGEMSLSIRVSCDELPASLPALAIYHVVLTSVDCQLLGQMISNKDRELDRLQLYRCSFPRLRDFLTLVEGFVMDKISSHHCIFLSCTVRDASIPKHDGTDYLDFVRIFGVFWERRHGEPEKRTRLLRPTRLEEAASDLLNYFRPMQQAGLLRLLPLSQNTESDGSVNETRQPRERWEWVEVMGHEAVINRADLLFHILLLNPEVCVLEQECSVVTSLKTPMVDNGNGDELHEMKSPSRKRRKQANK